MEPLEHLVPDADHRCRFVATSGARCTMPALRDDELGLCFPHRTQLQRTRLRADRKPPFDAGFHLVPLINFAWVADHADILENLNQTADALVRGVIDVRQANAMTALMNTCLRALRQRRALDKIEEPVRAFVEEQGLTLAPRDEPAPTSAAPSPLDTLSWDPKTPEGSHNLSQKLLWTYFRAHPENGVVSGLDLAWPGGAAFRKTPSDTPPDPSPTTDPSSTTGPAPSTIPAMTAACSPAPACHPSARRRQNEDPTPAKSTDTHRLPVTHFFSTLTQSDKNNPFLSHTSAKRKGKIATSVHPHPRKFSRPCLLSRGQYA